MLNFGELHAPLGTEPKTRGGAITRAAVAIAEQLDAKYVCAFTQSGDSARRLSRLRPTRQVFGFTPDERVWKQMALAWGIAPVRVPMVHHTDEMTEQVDATLLKWDLVEEGDLVVIAAGSPPGQAGSTNSLKVHRIGDLADFSEGGRSKREKIGPWAPTSRKRRA